MIGDRKLPTRFREKPDFFSFPLHQPGKPDSKPADHLDQVLLPMLFLSATRDELADMELLGGVCRNLCRRATLHALDMADHGHKVLKRTRRSGEDVFVEIARTVREWASELR